MWGRSLALSAAPPPATPVEPGAGDTLVHYLAPPVTPPPKNAQHRSISLPPGLISSHAHNLDRAWLLSPLPEPLTIRHIRPGALKHLVLWRSGITTLNPPFPHFFFVLDSIFSSQATSQWIGLSTPTHTFFTLLAVHAPHTPRVCRLPRSSRRPKGYLPSWPPTNVLSPRNARPRQSTGGSLSWNSGAPLGAHVGRKVRSWPPVCLDPGTGPHLGDGGGHGDWSHQRGSETRTPQPRQAPFSGASSSPLRDCSSVTDASAALIGQFQPVKLPDTTPALY